MCAQLLSHVQLFVTPWPGYSAHGIYIAYIDSFEHVLYFTFLRNREDGEMARNREEAQG